MKKSIVRYNFISTLFSLILPLLINIVIILVLKKEYHEQNKRNDDQFKLTAINTLENRLNKVDFEINILIQNSTIKDYFLLSELQKKHIENSVFDLLGYYYKELPLKNISILNSRKKVLLSYLPIKENQTNLLYFPISYNEKGINVFSKRSDGYITVNIDSEKIISGIENINMLTKIQKKQKDWNINLTFKDRKTTKVPTLLLIALALSIIGSITGYFIFRNNIVIPLIELHRTIDSGIIRQDNEYEKNEFSLIKNSFNHYKEENKKIQDILLIQQKNLAFINTARQVVHDIRSPLSALKMSLPNIEKLPVDSKVILKKSIKRIDDIANNLLEQSRIKDRKTAQSIHLLSFLNEIISSKRVEKQALTEVQISFEQQMDDYPFFIHFNKTEFYNIISNMINNSIEAFSHKKGFIKLRLKQEQNRINIIIQDNGKGIPDDVLLKLGKQELSYNKEKGNGLGLFHASNILKKNNSSIKIESQIEKGTIITLDFPLVTPPSWFSSKIFTKENIVLIDDDTSISSAFKEVLERKKLAPITVYENPDDYLKNQDQHINSSFIIDYEFFGSDKTGIELAELINDKNNTYILTNHYEDEDLREIVIEKKLKIVPKPYFDIVPIYQLNHFTIVLIDDDSIIRRSWQRAAKNKNLSLEVFESINDFLENDKLKPTDTLLFLDSNLKKGVKGELQAEELFFKGFKHIYLTTGYDASSLKLNFSISGVIGKSFPF